MRKWIQRLRGTVGMAVTWGAGWFGGAVAWLTLALWGEAPLDMILGVSVGIGVAGLVAGAGFAVVLGVAGRNRTLEQLRYLRIASFGALGAMLASSPLLMGIPLELAVRVFGVAGALGAVSSVVTLAIAKAAGRRPVGRLGGGDPDVPARVRPASHG